MSGARVVYVKGLEKKRLLEKYVPNVRNLEEFDCPSLKKMKLESSLIPCIHHTQLYDGNCSVNNDDDQLNIVNSQL